MMSRWLGILLYIIFFLVLVGANMALNITRGSTDKFTNPRCDSDTSINCDCLYGASCVTSKCFECQCDTNNPTFYQNGYSDGKCVKNEKFSVSLGKCIFIIYKSMTANDTGVRHGRNRVLKSENQVENQL